MTQALVTFTKRYVEMWNESDAVLRRGLVEKLWAPNGGNFAQTIEAIGYNAIEDRVTRSYETYIGTGEYRFRSVEPPLTHHNAVKIQWEMVRVADGAVASVGLEFLILDSEGRILSDHQFLVS